MRYYVERRRTKAEQDWIYREPVAELIPTVSDHVATDTGLVDRNGDPIMRAPNPMGFVW